MPASKFKIEKKCKQCGVSFLAKTVSSEHCSDACAQATYRQRRKEKKAEALRKEKAALVPDLRLYISISEAVTLFGISKDTIYRLIKSGSLPAVNLGTRLTRISRSHIEAMFQVLDPSIPKESIKPPAKHYSLEPEDCYTITEITEKFCVSPKTVYDNIRKNSIPTRQIGKYVYAPKSEINFLYTGKR